MFANGVETQLFLGGEVTVADKLAPFLYGGLHRHADGDVDLRDANLGLSWVPVWKPELVVRIRPGLSVPTGALTSGFLFTPLSSSSLDPWLAADVLGGGKVMVGGSLVARVPVYEGWDKIRQGPFARADLRASLRIPKAVPWVGVSGVHQSPSAPAGASPDFSELSAIAGAVISPAERWSVTVQLRVPIAVTAGASRVATGGLALRYVVGRRPDRDEDEHGEEGGEDLHEAEDDGQAD